MRLANCLSYSQMLRDALPAYYEPRIFTQAICSVTSLFFLHQEIGHTTHTPMIGVSPALARIISSPP